MFKLALRNIKSRPWRTVVTVFGIAMAVAMIFAMLSFKGAVYDFISASETAVAGGSDIKISTHSSSDRITTVTEDLENLKIKVKDEGGAEVEKTVDMDIVASLYLYATLDGEYVQARGFDTGKLEALQKVEIVDGEIDSILDGTHIDNVVVSESTAKHFGLKVGDDVLLSLGARQKHLQVGAIAKASGYFLDDSPYLVLGNVRGLSALVIGGEMPLCNEIYLAVKDGSDLDAVILAIKNIPIYSDMQVGLSHDLRYIDEQTTSLTAPVVLAGAAVLVLAVAIIAFVFLMGEKDKIDYIARLKIVGATTKQILAVFLIESVILAFVGGLLGSALAVGVFALILKITLKTSIIGISSVLLFVSALVGIVVAILSSLYPIAKSMRGTIRQNQTSHKKSKYTFILPIVFGALSLVSVAVELLTPLSRYFAVASLALLILTLFMVSPYVLKGVARLTEKASAPSVKTASKTLPRERRFLRSTSILTVGVTLSVMLFMAWNITTSVFDGFIKNFENVVFVSNIKSSVSVDDFMSTEGVESATKMVWQKSEVRGDGFAKNVNLLGSCDLINMINFEFITLEEDVKRAIAPNDAQKRYTDLPLVLVDVSMRELYGVDVGDKFEMTVKDKTLDVEIAGFLKHNLFNGNYVIMSAEALEKVGVDVDTVLVISSKDAGETVGAIKQKYASQNYYVVSALEAYKWDKESTSAVFDLVGTLAVVVGLLILIVSVFAAIIGRSGEEKGRTAMLSAGMSKGTLLLSETFQHSLIGAVSVALSIVSSVLLTSSLIHALALFGLYFGFMYNVWVVFVVGAVMGVLYALMPIILNFKRGYKLKKG